MPSSSFRPEPLPVLVCECTLASTHTGTPPIASAIDTTPAKSIIMKWSMWMSVSFSQVATVQPGPPRPSEELVISRVSGRNTSPVSGSVHLGMSSRVSRGMLTTDMLLRSAETCSSICTSARGVPLKVSLAPPSFWFSTVSRASEPISRMFSAFCPASLALVSAARSLASPRFSRSLLMLALRCS
ncbi:hypothetical protein RKD18_003593 [Streptomyces phaeoluteigriseus]